MVNPASGPRRVVVRASRETLVLVAAACAVTFALASAIRSRPADPPVVEAPQPQELKDWTGTLAEVSPDAQIASTEPMSSASLVVPKSALALPSVPNRPKPRPCDGTACPAKAVATTMHVKSLGPADPPDGDTRKNGTLISKLNPLNHLPNVSSLGRPFVYAGNAISGWFDRF